MSQDNMQDESTTLPGEALDLDEGASLIDAFLKRGNAPATTDEGDEIPGEETPPAEGEETETEVASGEITDEDETQPEDSATEEGEETEEETEEPAPLDPKAVVRTVKVDGKEVQVTLEDLEKSFSFTGHLTRKSQALADERKAFESERQAVAAERAKYATLLPQLEQALTTPQGEEIDWDKLRAENPIEFTVKWAEHQREQLRLQGVRAERERVEAQRQQEEAKMYQQHVLREEQATLEARPEWRDPKVRQGRMQAMVKYAMDVLGYTEDDLRQITDHRLLLILDDAEQLHRAKQAKPAAQQRARQLVKTAKPGPSAKISTAQTSALTKARQRATRSGSIDDAAALLQLSGLVK